MRGILLALLMVAMATVVVLLLTQFLDIRRGSVIYLVPVLIAGSRLGLVPSLVAAVAGVLLSGYFFFTPFYGFYITRPNEILNMTLFMVVAFVTSHLANSIRKQTELARRREDEVAELYAFSRRLAAATTPADIYDAIQFHIARLVQRPVVLFRTPTDHDGRGDLDEPHVPDAVKAEIATVQKASAAGKVIPDGAGGNWLVRRVSQQNPDLGIIAIDLGEAHEPAVTETRHHIDDVLSEAATRLERLDVTRRLHDARMRSETELLREALIGSVSHELRTPLSSILGAATIISNAPAVARDERLRALAQVVRDEAERLNADIQNLLDATRITRQQIRPKQQWVEPVDIVNSAVARRRRRLAGHNVSLDMDSDLPFIYADPVLVEQAFVQIIDNAAKYSPAGSTIDISARRNGRDVVLSARDTGAGVTAEEKSQLGERFFRGPRTAATTSGSGLGLWIAKAFVTANGGKLQVASEGAGLGTTMSLHLPLAAEGAQPVAGPDE
jgi:two-component system sensor histidine kinase KdpD